MNRMKIFIQFAVLMLLALLNAAPTNASVYVVDGPQLQTAMSTHHYCAWNVYGTCVLRAAQLAVKSSSPGPDQNRWIIVPANYLQPQGVRDDISWSVNYVISNGIPWRWGTCYADGTPLTAYNVMNCYH